MKLKIFTKNDCPNCPSAKKLGSKIESDEKMEVEFYNVDEAEGLAEAQFYSVLATPTIVLCDDSENEVDSWRGETPDKETVYKAAE